MDDSVWHESRSRVCSIATQPADQLTDGRTDGQAEGRRDREGEPVSREPESGRRSRMWRDIQPDGEVRRAPTRGRRL